MSDKCATNGKPWSATSSWDEVCRRASGRRHYNAVRSFRALSRRLRLAKLMLVKGGLRERVKGGWTDQGVQARLARELGVSRSTVCRDVAFLREQTFRRAEQNPEGFP